MRHRWSLIVFALSLCACQAAPHKTLVPRYVQPSPARAQQSTANNRLAKALQHYADNGSTAALQEYFNNHPDQPAGLAAGQILSLDQQLQKLRTRLQQLDAQQQACEQQSRQIEERAAQCKAQLDALAESLIKQERNLP